jgi:hypothetical protein
MSVEIGTEAAQFPEKEYINGIFVAVHNIMQQEAPHHYAQECGGATLLHIGMWRRHNIMLNDFKRP